MQDSASLRTYQWKHVKNIKDSYGMHFSLIIINLIKGLKKKLSLYVYNSF